MGRRCGWRCNGATEGRRGTCLGAALGGGGRCSLTATGIHGTFTREATIGRPRVVDSEKGVAF